MVNKESRYLKSEYIKEKSPFIISANFETIKNLHRLR